MCFPCWHDRYAALVLSRASGDVSDGLGVVNVAAELYRRASDSTESSTSDVFCPYPVFNHPVAVSSQGAAAWIDLSSGLECTDRDIILVQQTELRTAAAAVRDQLLGVIRSLAAPASHAAGADSSSKQKRPRGEPCVPDHVTLSQGVSALTGLPLLCAGSCSAGLAFEVLETAGVGLSSIIAAAAPSLAHQLDEVYFLSLIHI